MNNKFDELTRNMAQSVTRRGALKKFGVGIAGIALACLGLANNAEAKGYGNCNHCNVAINFGCTTAACYNWCYAHCFNTEGD